MPKPIVVIVGRPNVGKSTLFNRMTGSRAAIVENSPGVTRDTHYLDADWEGKSFVVVDTGGFYPEPSDDIFLQVKEQAQFAIEEGDLVIHLLDGKEGLTPSDIEISRLLRKSGKKVLWVVNKIDAPTREERLYDFYPLGAEELRPVSAVTGYGYDEFMDAVASLLPSYGEDVIDYPKVAVVGRPNVGKSTLINTLLGKKRMIVSHIPGTTRDAIDSICTYYGKKYLFIDTAGIRRKDSVGYSI
ncbi:MAG: ribosome biogenesis GTPase Der, partial [Nitrospirota bacterium]